MVSEKGVQMRVNINESKKRFIDFSSSRKEKKTNNGEGKGRGK